MDFKITDDDFIEYNIYPSGSDLSDSDLSELRDTSLRVLAPFIVDYLWHMDPFHLQIVPATRDTRAHLRGRLHFGDNIEDEWFTIALIFRLTSLLDVVATVRDADGEILLIEAADNLPAWAQEPELSDGRVFVYKGEVHLIPIARTPAELTPIPSSERPKTNDAISTVTQFSDITRASLSVQNVVRKRLRDYPENWTEQQHHARVTVPPIVRHILKTSPQMISAAIRAFYARDASDLKACRSMKHFPPTENDVTVRVRFTRCLYAMLAKPRYLPDKKSGWKIPLQSDPYYKAWDLGMKLTCGFEMLAAQASKRKSGPGDASRLSSTSSTKFEHFLKKLIETGYFQGEIEGSKKYMIWLEQARQYYTTSTAADDDQSNDLRFSSGILEIVKNYRHDASESNEDESAAKSDDESWLDVEPESFDALLRQHFKLGSEQMDFSSAGGAESNAISKSESELPNEIKRFLQSLSEFDGIQISHQNQMSDDMINMDPDAFGAALNKALNLASDSHGEFETNDDDMSSDDNEEDDAVIDLDRDVVSSEMSDYFGQMKHELRGTNVQDEEGPEEWDKPLDVDSKLLKNLLESFQSQDGAAGPTSTLLEPLGIKLNKGGKS